MRVAYGKNGQLRVVDGKGEEIIVPLPTPEDHEISIEADTLIGLRYGELEIQELHKARIEIRKGTLFREVTEP